MTVHKKTLAAISLAILGIALTGGEGRADDGLLAHWTFEQVDGGTVADQSGNGNPGIVHGAAPVSGVLGGALAFDGVDDYVELGDLGEHAAATVAFWMKADAAQPESGRWKGLVSSDGWEEGVLHIPYGDHVADIHIHLGGSQRARLVSPRLEPGQWYHVAVTADTGGRSTQLFVNGELVASDSLGSLDGPIRLIEQVAGRESEGRYFAGALDDVRIYSTALNAEQVRALCPEATPIERDPRDISTGLKIPDEDYCDQPYVVKLPDGSWLCTLTTGAGHEGAAGQHVVATTSSDQGKTWSPLIDIEPAGGPEASWVVPLVVPSGRVYAFYTYNGDKIRSLPGSSNNIRSDTHGWYCFKYSDDKGATWSQRYRIPMRLTACDLANEWNGEVQMFWGIDKPKVADGVVRFAFTKLGRYFLQEGEGWMMHSDNILTESDPGQINWTLIPDGEHGVRKESFGSVQEEHNHVPLDGERLYMVYRTTTGYPAHAYSEDGGRSWSEPEHMTYAPGGRKIKHPRACPKLWRCENGNYLFWFHNHSGRNFMGRNPAWITGGVLRDGRMHWSEPEILLYAPDPSTRMSYPDLIEQDGKYWISETQKEVARVHEIDPALLEGLWAQHEGNGQVASEGLVVDLDLRGQSPSTSASLPDLTSLAKDGGLTLECWVKLDSLSDGQILFDNRTAGGQGFALITENTSLRLIMDDGSREFIWSSDSGTLSIGDWHHVGVVIDGAADIATFIVDGRLQDGGTERQFGWSRLPPELADINGEASVEIGSELDGVLAAVRIYSRYLRTSEMISNYRAWSPPPASLGTLSYDGSYDPYSEAPPPLQSSRNKGGAKYEGSLVGDGT